MTIRRITLPFNVKKPILACGADLKGAFALAEGKFAFLVDGFGDLGDLDNLTKYEKAVKRYQKKLHITPRVIACDLHPDYFSTRFAEKLQFKANNSKLCKIQHHEAHVASAIIDNNTRGTVIGVAFDGTGYGFDGNIWGGEFFVGSLKNFNRAAHLGYVRMPGADAAIKAPWRMAASYIYRAFGDKFPALAKRWNKKELAILRMMVDKNMNSPLTSSAGRLFDAVGSLVLAKDFISKEAELPIELEKIIFDNTCEKYKFDVQKIGESYIIDTADIIRGVAKDLAKAEDKPVISCKFHNTIIDVILKTSIILSKRFKTKQAVLSGGVFQNKYLTSNAVKMLSEAGFKVYIHSNVPTNDSGIPLGQIAIANMRTICA